eukprot:jgi/Bigna1/147260/aug1.135_g21968
MGRSAAFPLEGESPSQPINLEVLEWKLEEYLRKADQLRTLIHHEKERRRRIMEQQRMLPQRTLPQRTEYQLYDPHPRDLKGFLSSYRASSLGATEAPPLGFSTPRARYSNLSSSVMPENSIPPRAMHSRTLATPAAEAKQQYSNMMSMNQQMLMFKKRQENASRTAQLSKKKWLQCPHCPKLFQNNSRLERHIRSHTGERPFQCSVCGDRFKQKCHLTVHLRRHQDFKCPMCGSQFMQKEALIAHMSTHLDVPNGNKNTATSKEAKNSMETDEIPKK